MARSRNIKPGLFKNELLVELPFEYRLLFIGLWTIADREGRLEDRPKKIKIELFPADSFDIDAGLDALAQRGFVARYVAGGMRCLQIINFKKHQSPHHKEGPSVIPAQDRSETSPRLGAEQHGEKAPDKPEANPERAALIPDSLQSDSLQQTCPAKPDRADFVVWYTAYPRHEAKDDAERAWVKRAKAGDLPPLAEMLATIGWQKRAGCLRPEFADGRSLIPLPATYLNKGRFKDARPGSMTAASAPTCCYCPAPSAEQINGAWYCASHAKDEREFLGRAA